MMNSHQLLARALKSHGIDYVTGILSDGSVAVVPALEQASIPFIRAMHEKNAVHIADGYYRACGRLMGIVLPSRTSLINAISGIEIASNDSSSMMVLNSDFSNFSDERMITEGTGVSNRVIDLTHITRFQARISVPEDIPEILSDAVKKVTEGIPGPLNIEFPFKISPIANGAVGINGTPFTAASQSVSEKVLADISNQILMSVNPVMVIGGRVISSDSSKELSELANLIGIPVISTCYAKGAFPEDHPLCGGTIHEQFRAEDNLLLKRADLLIALECHISPDVAKFNYNFNYYVEVGLNADICEGGIEGSTVVRADTKKFLLELLPVLRISLPKGKVNNKEQYRKLIRQVRENWIAGLSEKYQRDIGPLTLSGVITELRAAAEHDAIVVCSPGHIQEKLYHLFPVYVPRTFITSTHPSAHGWALPAAIGAKLAMPARQVICIVTANDFMLSVQELALCVMHALPVTFVVISDSSGASEGESGVFSSGSDMQFTMPDGKPYQPDYTDIARDIGLDAWKVEYISQLSRVLNKIVKCNGPSLIDMRVAGDGSSDIRGDFRSFPSSAYLSDDKVIFS